MKLYINTAFAAVMIMAAASCNNYNHTSEKQVTSTLTKGTDSFDYLRKHVKDEIAGTESVQLYLKDSIVLEGLKGIDVPGFSLADKDMWSSFQFSVYAGNKKLYLYNEDSKKVVNTVDLSKTYDIDQKVNCYVKNNTIYTVKWMSNDMICFDLSGRMLNIYKFPDTSKEMRCSLTAFPAISSFTLNRNEDMAMYMLPYINPSEKKEREKEATGKPIMLLHLSNNSMTVRNQIGIYPKEYIDHYYREIGINFINISDSSIAYLFRIFPKIYVQNIYNDKLQQQVIKGLPVNRVNPISENPEDIQNFSYTSGYELKSDSYSALAYDRDKKRYYIFRSLGIPPLTADGSLALFDDKPMILYVVDALTNTVIKKLDCGFTGKYSWFTKPVIYKNKLYMLRKKGNKRDALVKIDIYEIP